jgi:hypothetical protein
MFLHRHQGGRRVNSSRPDAVATARGLTPLVSNLLMVAVVIVIAMILSVAAMSFLPDDGEVSVRPEADFTVERDDGALVFDPQYMTDGVPFALLVNGQEVYRWEGESTTDARRLTCLNTGDDVAVRAEDEADRTYLMEDYDVEAPTACGISGAGSRFAYARVGDRQVPLTDPDYDFTLGIDPDGPNSVLGDRDFQSTNGWVYVQRYDRTIEGLSPPVYVVVFPDNVGSVSEWEAGPTDAERADMVWAYDRSGGDISVNGSAIEPTNDVYMVFKPGCDNSQVKFLAMSGSYNNQILIDGTPAFRTNDASSGQIYQAPGVECV